MEPRAREEGTEEGAEDFGDSEADDLYSGAFWKWRRNR